MSTMSVPRRLVPSGVAPGLGVAAPWPRQSLPRFERDAQFIELLNGYRHSGGMARATDVMGWLRQRGAADVATVGRWIATHEVVHLEGSVAIRAS